MGIRESLGGALEEKLNAAVDKAVAELDLSTIANSLKAKIDELINDNAKALIEPLADKLKANVIDLLDGEDDIPNV